MNTNAQNYVRGYMERAGKERILLYWFLVLCTAGYVALDAFAKIKYIVVLDESVSSFFIQCGEYVCGGGMLGLFILLLLEGERLVVAKEKLYRIPVDLLGVAWCILFKIMMDMARNMIFAGLSYYQGDVVFSGSRYVSFGHEVFINLMTAVMTLPFILVLANLLMIFVLQLKEGCLKAQ